jgi:probable F420-dependent oxidoreductase
VNFLYVYPTGSGPEPCMLDAGPVGELANAAEVAGFAGFGLTEHPAPTAKWMAHGGHQTLDPFVALGAAAAVTRRIKLVTYLTVTPYRNPMLLAKSAATLDLLSGGRFVLGMGTGYLKAEFRALGVDFEERNALFDEALDVLALHWSGQPFDYQGRHFEARDVIALPAPSGQIPIWIGGNAPLTLRRVAQRAQGWMPLTGPEQLFTTARTPALKEGEELATAVRDLRAAAGDRGADLDVLITYNDSLGDGVSDAGRHRDAFNALAAAGVTWVSVSGSSGSPEESLGFIERFGKTYIGV